MRKIHESRIDCSAIELDYSPGTIDTLDKYFDRMINEQKIQSASYVLSRHGKIFAHKALGSFSYKPNSPDMMPDSIRNAGSISKVFTAIAIMQLVERGQIHLHQSLCEIIPEFNTPVHRKIEVFHLLTHTSGVVADPGYFLEPYTTDDTFWSSFENESWISDMLRGPLQSPMGKSWNYSSAGFAILGELVKRISGISFKDYIHANIIQPLYLTNTWLGDIPKESLDRISFVSGDEEESYLGYYKKDSPLFASGGIDTTAYDLCRVGNMLVNNGALDGVQVLSRKSVEEMTRNHMNGQTAYFWGKDLPSKSFGLGLEIVDSDLVTEGTFGHDGSGYSCFYCDPAEQFVAAWFVPMISDYQWEPHIGIRSIIWSGIK